MSLTRTQVGILRDIANGLIDYEDHSPWMADQIVQLIMHDPQLVDVAHYLLILTPAGVQTLSQHTSPASSLSSH